jgi:hypothetical protein
MYWDPVAIERYTALGIDDGFGFYVNSRAAPLLPAGHQAVAASFATINEEFIRACVEAAMAVTTPAAIFDQRCVAIGDGLRLHVPEICEDLAAMAEPLTSSGRVLFACHRQAPRPDDQLISAWLAVNCLREWRGDTHFAVLVAEGIGPVAAGILDDARRNYGGWIPRSRGADDAAVEAAMAELEDRGLAVGGQVSSGGLELRADIEHRTDLLTEPPWRLLGKEVTSRFLDVIEPVGDRLVERIDLTAGPNWMPAARDVSLPTDG